VSVASNNNPGRINLTARQTPSAIIVMVRIKIFELDELSRKVIQEKHSYIGSIINSAYEFSAITLDKLQIIDILIIVI